MKDFTNCLFFLYFFKEKAKLSFFSWHCDWLCNFCRFHEETKCCFQSIRTNCKAKGQKL